MKKIKESIRFLLGMITGLIFGPLIIFSMLIVISICEFEGINDDHK